MAVRIFLTRMISYGHFLTLLEGLGMHVFLTMLLLHLSDIIFF